VPDEDDFDGFVILHTRESSPGEGWGAGPYPTLGVAKLVAQNMPCSCDKTVVGVVFPHGVSMAIDFDIDTSTPATRKGDHLN
jgi:hypothetical protein